jgi:hypothetical protein
MVNAYENLYQELWARKSGERRDVEPLAVEEAR